MASANMRQGHPEGKVEPGAAFATKGSLSFGEAHIPAYINATCLPVTH